MSGSSTKGLNIDQTLLQQLSERFTVVLDDMNASQIAYVCNLLFCLNVPVALEPLEEYAKKNFSSFSFHHCCSMVLCFKSLKVDGNYPIVLSLIEQACVLLEGVDDREFYKSAFQVGRLSSVFDVKWMECAETRTFRLYPLSSFSLLCLLIVSS